MNSAVSHKNSFQRASTNLKSDTPKNDNIDNIGPPDPVSNLRPVSFAKYDNESNLEKRYREARETTQSWNQNFWTKHNNSFVKVSFTNRL